MPIVNQIYNIIKTILRDKLLGIKIYNFKKKPINKIKTPTNKINLTNE